MIDTSREWSAAGVVALDGGGALSAVRRVGPPVARCRPGESPCWVRLDLTPSRSAELRDAAYAARVALDTWLAITLEFALGLRILARGLGSLNAARTRLDQRIADCPIEMARDPDWRAWQASLSARAAGRSDELPEVVVPGRLLARTGGDIDHSVVLQHISDWPLARMCELVACGRGQALEALMLEVALLDVQRK